MIWHKMKQYDMSFHFFQLTKFTQPYFGSKKAFSVENLGNHLILMDFVRITFFGRKKCFLDERFFRPKNREWDCLQEPENVGMFYRKCVLVIDGKNSSEPNLESTEDEKS
jgi:hypothetical protein